MNSINIGFSTKILKPYIPVPIIYKIGEYNNYIFAVEEFIYGITLRDLLLNNPDSAWHETMVQVGEILGTFQQIHFSQSGLFNNTLQVTEALPDMYNFIYQLLDESPNILNYLNSSDITTLKRLFENNRQFFEAQTPCLVHGDFDPANILVAYIDNKWRISAILDWEFAHSGNWLLDVANMLRYSHKMPDSFESAFLQGLKNKNIILPDNWRTIIDLFNLASLLNFLAQGSINKNPNMKQDVLELIRYFMSKVNLQ